LAGAPKSATDKLQRVINAAARVVSGTKKYAWYTTSDDCIAMQLRLKKCSEYWSGRIEADQSYPRKLWKSVDTLLGRGHLPAISAIDVASFSRFFADKVAKVRSSTSSALPRLYVQPSAVWCVLL